MFDVSVVAALDEAVDGLSQAAFDVATTDQLAEVLRRVQTGLDALAGVHARAVDAFDAAGGHEQDGCARVGMWLRRELRLSSTEIRRRRRAAEALKWLPQVRAAAEAGQIRPEHVDVFAAGIAKVGPVVMGHAQQLLVPLARDCEPGVLRQAVDAGVSDGLCKRSCG